MSATVVTRAPSAATERTFVGARRQLTSILAPAEKRVLVWLAERLPSRVNSDHLTALALVAMAGAGLSYWSTRWSAVGLLAVNVCLALNWFGDSLDGTVARVRNRQRPRYGFYVDHVVDALGALFLLAGLGASGYMHPLVAAALLAAYLLLLVETFLATHVLGTFKMSHFSIGPTELRLILAIGNLVLLWHPYAHIAGMTLRLFDLGGAVASVGLLVTFARSALTNTRHLYELERLDAARTGA